ncbi:MAG: hypothetical protein V4457_04535 [Pseudomonadota bacterium]
MISPWVAAKKAWPLHLNDSPGRRESTGRVASIRCAGSGASASSAAPLNVQVHQVQLLNILSANSFVESLRFCIALVDCPHDLFRTCLACNPPRLIHEDCADTPLSHGLGHIEVYYKEKSACRVGVIPGVMQKKANNLARDFGDDAAKRWVVTESIALECRCIEA